MLDQVRGSQSELAELRRKVAAMGANFDPDILEATRALYAPLIKTKGQVKVTADIAYGTDARQKLVAFIDHELGTSDISVAKTYMEDPLRLLLHLIMSQPEYQLG